jgi:hypothetical protein
MEYMARGLLALCALFLLALPVSASAQTKAGVASVDATWHVGASAGQFTDEGGVLATPDAVDPHQHVTKKRISDGVALRTSTRALVVEDSAGDRVAIVSTDLYLPQDFLLRRVVSLLPPSLGITGENLAMTASHNHNTPYYSTPGWGTAIFQDVFDLRFYDYMARRMAQAITEAAGDLVPVRMGGATRTFNEIQSHTYGPKVGDDGTPAGQPYDHTTKQLSVVRFDDISDPQKPQPLANWVVFGVHPEWTWGYDLINGDITMAAARMVDRDLGTVSVFSQRETGTSGPHKDTRVHQPEARREFQDNGFGQLDRGARFLADGIKKALDDIEKGRPQHPEAFQAFVTDFDVASVSERFAPPKTRPYPGVSNCNTMSFFHGDPRVPIVGLPDCGKANDYGLQPVTDAYKPVTSPMYDQLKAAGIPVPESYSGTALTAVEETNAVHLMAMRFGGIVATFCPCEQFTDTALNIQSRLDKVEGNIYKGFDWADQKTPAGRDWCVPGDGDTWTCANPQNPASDLAPISDEAYRRFRAQIKNDASGWEDDLATLGSEAEPKDPSKIKGNFTHEEFPQHGYNLALSVGMANDYWGYIPEYREYRSHDHYRKALSGLGPHAADFLATRLGRLGASLNGGPAVELSPLDLVFLAEQGRAQALAVGLGEIATAYSLAYERSLPADGGTPAVVEQPSDITRFGAAHLRFVGGSNYTDLPDVRVERRIGQNWVPYGDEHGDVQLMVDFPAPDQLADWRTDSFEWVWTASFEAFSSDIRQPDASGHVRDQTPAGTYRFVVDGKHRPAVAGDPAPYRLESEPFEIAPWGGLAAEDLRVDDGGRVSFADSLIDYPDSYASPFRFINPERRTLVGNQVYCSRCSFRPWADTGRLETATVTFTAADGSTREVPATLDTDGRWRTAEVLAAGESAQIEAGGLEDGFGETNAAPSETVARQT